MSKEYINLEDPLEKNLFLPFSCPQKCGFYSFRGIAQRCPNCSPFERIFPLATLSAETIDEKFDRFFTRKGFVPYPEAPLICTWKDDSMFTNASIYLFQPHYTRGGLLPHYQRVFMRQKCIRFSDLDLIGKSSMHWIQFTMLSHTAFNSDSVLEMDYSYEQCLEDCLNFFKELGTPEEEIVISIGEWDGGGSSGPCYEIFIRGIEVATLVFIEKSEGGYIVDTGYGLERIAAVFGDASGGEDLSLKFLKPLRTLYEEGIVPGGCGRPNVYRLLLKTYREYLKKNGLNPPQAVDSFTQLILSEIELMDQRDRENFLVLQRCYEKNQGRISPQDAQIFYESLGVSLEDIRKFLPGFVPSFPSNERTSGEKLAHFERIRASNFPWWDESRMHFEIEVQERSQSIAILEPNGIFPPNGGQCPDVVHVDGKLAKYSCSHLGVFLELTEPVQGKVRIEVCPDFRRRVSEMHSALHVIGSLLEILLGRKIRIVGSNVRDSSSEMTYLACSFEVSAEIVNKLKSRYNEYKSSKSSMNFFYLQRPFFESIYGVSLLNENTPLEVRFQRYFIGQKEFIIPCGGTHVDTSLELPDLEIRSSREGYNRYSLSLKRSQ